MLRKYVFIPLVFCLLLLIGWWAEHLDPSHKMTGSPAAWSMRPIASAQASTLSDRSDSMAPLMEVIQPVAEESQSGSGESSLVIEPVLDGRESVSRR